MTILLDENFPLRLYRRLLQQGHAVEHIIMLGQRGISDTEIRRRLKNEVLLFLTNDTEFLVLPPGCRSTILLSRVSQSLPLEQRVTLWVGAIDQFFAHTWTEQLFEVGNDGLLRPL
ncbi:MAG: DUF5615 family PIN-like protein [Armatimonadota bacterium]|nr:DUF5615 family PIN-like protein [Armatimonadota bacterium]